MKMIAAVVSAAAIAAAPTKAAAGEQYATTEATYYSEADRDVVLTTLRATADQAPIDGEYHFDGFAVLAAEGLLVPVTVIVPAELPTPDVVAVLESAQAGAKGLLEYEFEAGGVLVTKSVYEIVGETTRGLLTVTDDPLPIVTWLIIAGASSIIIPIGIYMFECERITTRTTFSIDGTATFETSCDMP
jgi:hypothetical protein